MSAKLGQATPHVGKSALRKSNARQRRKFFGCFGYFSLVSARQTIVIFAASQYTSSRSFNNKTFRGFTGGAFQ
ncbi:hypothetical protein PQR63_08930 [Herbaspirillum rhizosphaerae]|uniref:Uncharacterized protein n=1 Tax=Herbaspirillum rhizosphaerae TaxID=346179 RepID=A0ABW8Z8T2_9BURK